jgi:peptidyl-prolyl cis-trans isomerase SurA
MVRRKILLALSLIAAFTAYVNSQDILMTIGDKKITLDEFERIYNKNNSNLTSNQQSPEEYLDLFINFKLKVIEAENLGMDTTKKFLNEFNGYKDQLAKPYMTDEKTKELLMKEAYERMKWDVHVSHILLGISSQASPEDTLARYEKALEIRKRILEGEDFEKVARATSEDPSARMNGGDLGYFTAFMMVYPFETAAYSLEKGEISMPVRTQHGYHIIKKHGKRPAAGQVKVAHIFIRNPEGTPAEEQEKAKSLAMAIGDSLEMGINFEILAIRHSDDRNSAANGGELPWFGTGRMIREFETRAFGLKDPGDFCDPFKTDYGWHIIKLLDKKGIGTYEEMKSTLQSQAVKGDRDRVKRERYLEKLKENYDFQLDKDLYSELYYIVDSTIFAGEWKPNRDILTYGENLFTITGKEVTLGNFASHLQSIQKKRNPMPIENYVDMIFNQYIEELLINLEKESLPEKYPEYRYILQEYHDGILLFELMDQKVWSKAVEDSTGLEKFFEDHRSDYMWDERMEAIIVSSDSTIDLDKVKKRSKRIAKGRWDEKRLNRKFCEKETPCITLEKIRVEAGKNEHVDALNGSLGTGEVYKENGLFKFVITAKTLPPMEKELNETRGQVTSDYQDFLEKRWIEDLRKKYKVSVNKELLSKIEP